MDVKSTIIATRVWSNYQKGAEITYTIKARNSLSERCPITRNNFKTIIQHLSLLRRLFFFREISSLLIP
jgi:hypothetical protein